MSVKLTFSFPCASCCKWLVRALGGRVGTVRGFFTSDVGISDMFNSPMGRGVVGAMFLHMKKENEQRGVKTLGKMFMEVIEVCFFGEFEKKVLECF